MKERTWDTDKALVLHGQGLLDAEIAEKVGATTSAVSFWRRKQGLPSNRGRAREPEAGKDLLPVRLPASPLRPLALPQALGPVELSIELDGRAFALRAPDLEGAAWIHKYAGRLLEDMRRTTGKEGTNDA